MEQSVLNTELNRKLHARYLEICAKPEHQALLEKLVQDSRYAKIFLAYARSDYATALIKYLSSDAKPVHGIGRKPYQKTTKRNRIGFLPISKKACKKAAAG